MTMLVIMLVVALGVLALATNFLDWRLVPNRNPGNY